tara:strand:- start:417 stop:626 length:210 start_codon:yes stop_codon:yes gene_type:complete
MRRDKRELQKTIAKNLSRAEHWLAVRIDKEGKMAVDMTNASSLTLLAVWFKNDPDTFKKVQELMEQISE